MYTTRKRGSELQCADEALTTSGLELGSRKSKIANAFVWCYLKNYLFLTDKILFPWVLLKICKFFPFL